MPSATDHRVLPAFLLFTFGLSTIFYCLIATGGGGDWIDYTGCLMWCPAIGALITCRFLGRSFSSIAWRWGATRWEVACYLIPLAYSIVTFLPAWITGIGKFYNKPFLDLVSKDFGFGPLPAWARIALYFFFTATITVLKGGASVLGEEIGWRGFLVPELAKRNTFAKTALISRAIWALWHYPILLFRLLSQPDSGCVLPACFHCQRNWDQFPVDLDAAQVGQHLALRRFARGSQYIHPKIF